MHGGRLGWAGGGKSRGLLSWESGARYLVRGGVAGVVVNLGGREWGKRREIGDLFYLGAHFEMHGVGIQLYICYIIITILNFVPSS